MDEMKTPVRLSLLWSRMVIYEHSLHGKLCEEALISFYNSLVDKTPYHVSNKNNKIVITPNGKNYGDRTLQRRRTYEMMELIRDTIFHRKVEYGESVYSF